MGKATINSNLGDGQYQIASVFDTEAAAAQLAKLETVLAKVQARIAEEPEIVELRILMIRERALQAEIAKVDGAASLSRTQTVWCGDLTDDLTGTVGTVEIETDPVHGGLMIQPGYAGNAAYDADRDGLETPFRTLFVADAMLNFALMPAIQKWKPTYRYGTVSNVDPQAGTCDLALETANSYIQAININQWTYFSGVPVEYMSCNAAAFESGDEVLAQYFPYDATGTIKVVGFKDHPKPCESRHLLIELTSAWLLYDIVGRRTAYNLGEGAPTFPCIKNTANDAWVAAHCTTDSNDTLYAYIGDTVDEAYIDPNRTFGAVFDWWFAHQDAALATTMFLGGVGCNVAGWGTSQGSAVCLDGYSEKDDYGNPYLTDFPSHTGETLESTYGDNYGNWAPECCKFKPDPPTEPPNFIFYNSYREWFQYGPLAQYLNKIIYSNGSEGNRAFVVCTDGYGETYYNYQAYIISEHRYYSTLHFFSPFEADELPTTIELWDQPASSTDGIDVASFTSQVQTKHNLQDMVGVCTFSWKIHDKSGGADQVGEDSPHADWYVSKDIETSPIPNPWGSHLQRDENLSTIFANMVNTYNAGTLNGFQYNFVDVTIT